MQHLRLNLCLCISSAPTDICSLFEDASQPPNDALLSAPTRVLEKWRFSRNIYECVQARTQAAVAVAASGGMQQALDWDAAQQLLPPPSLTPALVQQWRYVTCSLILASEPSAMLRVQPHGFHLHVGL